MKLTPVASKAEEHMFLQVPHAIYRNDPQWIAPLQQDIADVFDPKKNPALAQGEAARWVLSHKGKFLGRVAAYINREAVAKMPYPVGSIGFFECVNDPAAAQLLLDTAANWLQERGMKAADGPVNFGEKDKFWGLLVESHTRPMYQEAYNPPYYQQLWEGYGFQKYFDQLTYQLEKKTFNWPRLAKIAGYVTSKPRNTFEYLDMGRLDKYAADFVEVYNAAWSKFDNFKPVELKDIMAVFRSIKPVAVPEYIWFAYVEGQPAGFLVILPDVNDILRHFNGRLGLWEKLRFLYYRRVQPIRRLKALVFGIHPDHQQAGLDAGMLYHFGQEVLKRPVHNPCEIAWVGGFNPKMISLMQALGGTVVKQHNTYRKIFDPAIPFEPYKLGEYQRD